jgi:hypothetical protein
MITVASSRFNQKTWNENCDYRERKKIEGCIYCTPLQLSPKILPNSLIFVAEMNNTRNKIEGIGLICNAVQFEKYVVYENGNYNRFVYKSKYRINRDDLKRYNKQLVKALDHILFREKTHLKRGSGITTVPEKLLTHKVFKELDARTELKNIFKIHFQNTEKTSSNEKRDL